MDDGRAAREAKKTFLGPFAVISISYVLFTMTDGAVRMLVLMHAYARGFDAMEVATMFTLYELCGAATNLCAGVAGARFGVRQTLCAGLGLQVVGFGMLFAWDDGWSKREAIAFVTVAQAICGVAKDLTKLGGKTVTKLVTPEDKQKSLFKLVSAITGLKNSFKGVGYFVGAAMLGVSYEAALWMQIALVAAALPFAVFGLDNSLGRVAKKNITVSTVFKQSYNMNVLSLSRMFLFGSRDLWFEVPLPFFLRSAEGMGWPRSAVGALLAGYIIVYGQLAGVDAAAVSQTAQSKSAEQARGGDLERGAGERAALPRWFHTIERVSKPFGRDDDENGRHLCRCLRLRVFIRRELGHSFLLGGQVRRRKQGGDKRRLLLHGQRLRPTHRHHH